ncbi:hypothetical protein AB3N04_02850 [Alkalihalophilus sp. As8PL]|uniref:Transposase n=1 Tax=Alkalihalophilus sp. As8PL TaxID=3237103 RepID=A0AB39BUM0_9BACI
MSSLSVDWNDTTHSLKVIDQRYIPQKEVYHELRSIEQVWEAITFQKIQKHSEVEVASAFGLVLWSQFKQSNQLDLFLDELCAKRDYLCTSKQANGSISTSVNRVVTRALKAHTVEEAKLLCLKEAKAIQSEKGLMS